MTREQAKREIDSLDYYLQNHTDDYGEESHTAMMMAIKALEQEPCEDAISREEAIDACNQSVNILEATDRIKDLPPVCQEPKWIPVSERLPEKNVEVLATTEWDCVTIAEMFSNNDWFIYEGNANADTDEIVAWMPLPEPYKAESEEK